MKSQPMRGYYTQLIKIIDEGCDVKHLITETLGLDYADLSDNASTKHAVAGKLVKRAVIQKWFFLLVAELHFAHGAKLGEIGPLYIKLTPLVSAVDRDLYLQADAPRSQEIMKRHKQSLMSNSNGASAPSDRLPRVPNHARLHEAEIYGDFRANHQNAIRRWHKVREIRHIRTYGSGQSGAGIYLVDVEGSDGKHCHVLKVGSPSEIQSEIEFSRKAHERLGDTVPPVYDKSEPGPDGLQAVMLKLAYDQAIRNSASLSDILDNHSSHIEERLNTLGQKLRLMNPPKEVIEQPAGLMKPAQFVEMLSRIGMDPNATESRLATLESRLFSLGIRTSKPLDCYRVFFQGDPTSLPNPIYYAQKGLIKHCHRRFVCIPMTGLVHGDLHTENILFPDYDNTDRPQIIDFAKGHEEMPIIFDWLYLEWDILFRAAPVVDRESWKRWQRLVRAVTSSAREDVQFHWWVNRDGMVGDDWLSRILKGIEALRASMADYWSQADRSRQDMFITSFWLSGYYAGLNYARKNETHTLTSRDTLKRYAALYYAARCLQCLFETMNFPIPDEDFKRTEIGPYLNLFINPAPSDNQQDAKVYFCAAKQDEINHALSYSYKRNFVVRPSKANPTQQDVVNAMCQTEHFLCIINAHADENELEQSLNRTIAFTFFECEASLVCYPTSADRLVLVQNAVLDQLDANHPIKRDKNSGNRDFKVKPYQDDSELSTSVQDAMLKWWGPMNSGAVKPDELFLELDLLPLVKEINQRLVQSRVQIVQLVGANDSSTHNLLWEWLHTQIHKAALPRLKYPPAIVGTEDHYLSPDWIFNVLDAWMTSKNLTRYTGVPTAEGVRDYLFRDIARAMNNVNVYFLIPKLNRYETELAAFREQFIAFLLNNPTIDQRAKHSLVFIVEDTGGLPPNAIELRLEDLRVERAAFDTLVTNRVIRMEEIIFRPPHPLANVQWTTELFGAATDISSIQFLENLLRFT